jgi:hypothetical protein
MSYTCLYTCVLLDRPPQERDGLVEALQRWRLVTAYDMVKAWDARARKWFGERYDFRRNMVSGTTRGVTWGVTCGWVGVALTGLAPGAGLRAGLPHTPHQCVPAHANPVCV